MDVCGRLASGPAVIPAGVIITAVVGPDGELTEPPTWNGIPLPVDGTRPMPIDAAALDEEGALQMLRWCPARRAG
jgi:hypothetical protein